MRYYEVSRDSHATSVMIGQCFLVGKTKRANFDKTWLQLVHFVGFAQKEVLE